ncbi:MAG: hypothetical protein K0Q56_396 [Sporolactobacillus laevolacticus]|nr:hypothetical protein [Sporolactobacillus laevolacticus]
MSANSIIFLVLKWLLVSCLCWIPYFVNVITSPSIIIEGMVLVMGTGAYAEYLMKKGIGWK